MRKGLLIILDGYGEGKQYPYNPVIKADTPFLKSLKAQSKTEIKTDSEAVGLLPHTMGGSEVGHMTIGAGRIIHSTASAIANDIKSGAFEKNEKFVSLIKKLDKNGGDLHLIGMMSDKNIHSDINHAIEIIRLTKTHAKHIYIHFISDGRDTNSFVAPKYLKMINTAIKSARNAEIISVSGRLYAMDREGNLDRTTKAFEAMFHPKKFIDSTKIEDYIKSQYDAGNTDEYIEPISVKSSFKAVKKEDILFFFNFREDRLRQIVKMTESLGCDIYTMANVGGTKSVALYPEKMVEHTLSEHLSNLGLRQVKVSESTKYAHVTYFLNGGREEPFKNEDRIHVPTIKVDRFDKTPKMRAYEITNKAVQSIKSGYDAVIVNYSNPDMIGHTGNYEATKIALEYLDKCVKRLVDSAIKNNYAIVITADHGNAEYMKNEDGSNNSAHTLNHVFFVVIIDGKVVKTKAYGGLKDVAPTLLDAMQVEKNPYFEGKSLIQS